jgi:glycosyltransferase 2 family protein
MKAKSIVLQSILFACIGVVLIYLSFQKVDIDSLLKVLKTGNYVSVVPVFFVSLLVYLSRVKRWQLLFEATGEKLPANFLLASLASGYLVNFVVPRLGEFTRAIVLKKWLSTPMHLSVSTIVFERIVDILSLILILTTAFILEMLQQGSFLNEFTNGVDFLTKNKLIIILMILIAGFIFYLWVKNRKNSISRWSQDFMKVFKELCYMKNKGWFLFHTCVIWLGFYLMTYLWFFLFQESSELSMYEAYLVMVLGVIARTLPIQAGSAGAYHFVVSKALMLLGIGNVIANAIALIIHGFQAVFTILFGTFAYVWLLGKNKINS